MSALAGVERGVARVGKPDPEVLQLPHEDRRVGQACGDAKLPGMEQGFDGVC